MVVHASSRKIDDVEINCSDASVCPFLYQHWATNVVIIVKTHVWLIYPSLSLVYSSMQCHNHQLIVVHYHLHKTQCHINHNLSTKTRVNGGYKSPKLIVALLRTWWNHRGS